MLRFYHVAAVCLCVTHVGAVATVGLQAQTGPDWSYFGGDHAFTRYSALEQIDGSNVDRLGVVWRRPAADPSFTESFDGLTVSNYLRSTPIMVEGVLYAPNGIGLVEAFDPSSGETLWLQRPFAATLDEARGRSNKGLHNWSSGAA